MPTLAGEVFNVSLWNVGVFKADGTTLTSAQQIATAVEFPALVRNFDTDARAGLPGIVPQPLGFSQQELTVSLKGFTQEFWTTIHEGTFRNIKLQLKADGCRAGTMEHTPIVLTCNGIVSQLPGIGFQALSNVSSEFKMMLSDFSLLLGETADLAEFLLVWKPASYLYTLNGTNLLAASATAIGVTPGT